MRREAQKVGSYAQDKKRVPDELSTLSDWLTWIGSVHDKTIDLGLDRIHQVAASLALLKAPCPLIIVGGTNGKGSTVAALEAIYRGAGYQTGVFTSPYLFKHNEEVRINGVDALDQDFCEAFALIERARDSISLTPFEFHTLAAVLIFKKYSLDVWILEVGMGGRLDAVNMLDADVAVTTSIGIDHVEWLGSTREAIGNEKAGIYRKNKFAVCGDPTPPSTLLQTANKVEAIFLQQQKDFVYEMQERGWSWCYQQTQLKNLAYNQLYTQNMSTALMVVHVLQPRLPVKEAAIREGLQQVSLIGRVQIIEKNNVTEIFDVSHNLDSITLLASRLKAIPCDGKTLAVFSMLKDKDMVSSIQSIQKQIDEWFVAPLSCDRATSLSSLKQIFATVAIHEANFFETMAAAHEAALMKAKSNDRVVVFGSFHTVSECYEKK